MSTFPDKATALAGAVVDCGVHLGHCCLTRYGPCAAGIAAKDRQAARRSLCVPASYGKHVVLPVLSPDRATAPPAAVAPTMANTRVSGALA